MGELTVIPVTREREGLRTGSTTHAREPVARLTEMGKPFNLAHSGSHTTSPHHLNQ